MKKESKNANYPKTIIVPVKTEMWKSLRKISFDSNISMSSLMRSAIEKIINKHSKTIDL